MSTAVVGTRRSSEIVGGAGWLGVDAATGAQEAWAGTDGEVYGRPKWL